MDLSEEELNYLEEQIPEMTEQATQLAYFTTLAQGHSVVIAENGQIVEVFPDGTKKVRKALAGKFLRARQRRYLIK